jgi:phospholipid/cholesterol/gamma-HCH transport system permease protein
MARHPADIPWREFTCQRVQGRCPGLTRYGAGRLPDRRHHQLPVRPAVESFGADLFIVNILGISIIRELGPVLVAVLVAGVRGRR